MILLLLGLLQTQPSWANSTAELIKSFAAVADHLEKGCIVKQPLTEECKTFVLNLKFLETGMRLAQKDQPNHLSRPCQRPLPQDLVLKVTESLVEIAQNQKKRMTLEEAKEAYLSLFTPQCIENNLRRWQKDCAKNRGTFTPPECQTIEETQVTLKGPYCEEVWVEYPDRKEDDLGAGSFKYVRRIYSYPDWKDYAIARLKSLKAFADSLGKLVDNLTTRDIEDAQKSKDIAGDIAGVDRELQILDLLKQGIDKNPERRVGLPKIVEINKTNRTTIQGIQEADFFGIAFKKSDPEHLIDSGVLPTLMAQAATGLANYHELLCHWDDKNDQNSRCYTHSDIKPENMMGSHIEDPAKSSGNIIDFGLSFDAYRLCMSGKSSPGMGTKEFFAPEQWERRWAKPYPIRPTLEERQNYCKEMAILSTRSDVFAKAVSFLVMIYPQIPLDLHFGTDKAILLGHSSGEKILDDLRTKLNNRSGKTPFLADMGGFLSDALDPNILTRMDSQTFHHRLDGILRQEIERRNPGMHVARKLDTDPSVELAPKTYSLILQRNALTGNYVAKLAYKGEDSKLNFHTLQTSPYRSDALKREAKTFALSKGLTHVAAPPH